MAWNLTPKELNTFRAEAKWGDLLAEIQQDVNAQVPAATLLQKIESAIDCKLSTVTGLLPANRVRNLAKRAHANPNKATLRRQTLV